MVERVNLIRHSCLDSIRRGIDRNDRDSGMNRPYTAHSPYSLSPTERFASGEDEGDFRSDPSRRGGVSVDSDRERRDEYPHLDDYEDSGEYADYEAYEYYEPIDRRWIWVAGVAGAILLVAVIFGLIALTFLLGYLIPDMGTGWWVFIFFVLFLVTSIVLALLGKSRLRVGPPEHTIATLREVVEWAKLQIKRVEK